MVNRWSRAESAGRADRAERGEEGVLVVRSAELLDLRTHYEGSGFVRLQTQNHEMMGNWNIRCHAMTDSWIPADFTWWSIGCGLGRQLDVHLDAPWWYLGKWFASEAEALTVNSSVQILRQHNHSLLLLHSANIRPILQAQVPHDVLRLHCSLLLRANRRSPLPAIITSKLPK